MDGTKGRLSAIVATVVALGCLAGCSNSSQNNAADAGADTTSSQAGGADGSSTGTGGSGADGGRAGTAPGDGGSTSTGAGDGGSTSTGSGDGSSGSTATEDGGSVNPGHGDSGVADTGNGTTGAGDSGGDSGGSSTTLAIPNCGSGTLGVTNCGAGGSGSESCCTSLAVTEGTYDRTYTNSGTGATGEANPATISAFRLDEYLVTVGRFRQFVNAWRAGYAPPAGSGKHTHLNGGSGLVNSASPGTYETGWLASDDGNLAPTDANLTNDSDAYATWTASVGANDSLPINGVNWWEAYAFCIWDGGFLPSEAEWEYTAAGGSQQREYPWGSTAPGMGNEYAIYGDGESECYYPTGAAAPCTGVANFAPVGYASKGAGYWGQLDLVGEVFEWNLDWYATYAACTDCAYLTSTGNRVMRGDLLNDASLLAPSQRFDVNPEFRAVDLGFRCARTPTSTTTGTTGSTTGTTTGSTTGAATGVTTGTEPGMDAAVVVPVGCTLPLPVSFQTDVQGFLNTSCGKIGTANASNGGCHVLDDESTMIEGGKDHAYDWITGTAHASSCPQTPTPFRFQVVMATMEEADPPSCSACGNHARARAAHCVSAGDVASVAQ
jgi:formylglycine-generating enzyme required for sulfatase activity